MRQRPRAPPPAAVGDKSPGRGPSMALEGATLLGAPRLLSWHGGLEARCIPRARLPRLYRPWEPALRVRAAALRG